MSDKTLVLTFTNLRKGFLRLAYHFLQNEEDADDALQEAFCRLWPRRDDIQTMQEAEALTVTTVRNLCIDKIRKNRIQTVDLAEWRDLDCSEGVDTVMERDEQFREIEKIIKEHLTPLQQLIIQRKEYEDKSIEEISNELNMQSTAVRMQLSRARKAIRECYQKRNDYDKKR